MKMIDDVCIPLSTIKEWHKVLDGWRTGMSNEADLLNVMNTLEDIVKANEEEKNEIEDDEYNTMALWVNGEKII